MPEIPTRVEPTLRRFDQAHTQLRILRENNHGSGHGLGHTAYTAILHLAAGRVHNAAAIKA
jgi:hypothetical protein